MGEGVRTVRGLPGMVIGNSDSAFVFRPIIGGADALDVLNRVLNRSGALTATDSAYLASAIYRHRTAHRRRTRGRPQRRVRRYRRARCALGGLPIRRRLDRRAATRGE